MYTIRATFYALNHSLRRQFPIQSHLTDGFTCPCLRSRLAANWLKNVGVLKTLHLLGTIPDGYWMKQSVTDYEPTWIWRKSTSTFRLKTGTIKNLFVDWHFSHSASALIFISCRSLRSKLVSIQVVSKLFLCRSNGNWNRFQRLEQPFPSVLFGSLKDILWIFYWSKLERI